MYRQPITTPTDATGELSLWLTVRSPRGDSDFEVELLAPQPGVARAAVRLHRAGSDPYDLSVDPYGTASCTCGDATFRPERPGGCKHLAAWRQELRRLAPLVQVFLAARAGQPARDAAA